MTIDIRYKNKRGAGCINSFSDYNKACEYLIKLFKRKTEARLFVNDKLKGESIKQGNKWNYYYEK